MQTDQTPTFAEVAEAIAPGWERRRGFVEAVSEPVREWIVQALDARPGDTVLELAAGVGDTGYDIASIIGPEGRVISSDFSPGMVAGARRRAAERGVGDNVEHRVIDAQRIELADDAVDRALCRFGYMLMPDPPAALAETRRVLRPGGRLALAVWGRPEANPYFAAVGMALVAGGHIPPPDPAGPGIFNMSEPERARSLLEGAGFASITVEEVPVRFRFADLDECLEITADTAGPMALALRGLADSERAALKSRLEHAYGPFVGEGAYEIPGLALAAVAS